MINFENITKTFKVNKRDAGIKKSIKALFSNNYQKLTALDDVSFKVKRGEIVGFIGPNGAGKSTAIKIMSGILLPDSGKCEIDGIIPWENRNKHVFNIGTVFGQRTQLWWDTPVVDSFELIKEIYDIDSYQYKINLEELVSILNLSEILKTPVRQLSLGQRMCCDFVASLLHNPKILFLDEPTIGLDSITKFSIRNFIKKINKQKKTTIILTTHDTQDIEELATKILLLKNGKVFFDGEVIDFKKSISVDKFIKVTYSQGNFNQINDKNIIIEKISNKKAILKFNSNKVSLSNVIDYINQEVKIVDIYVDDINIEDIILNYYKGVSIQ